MVGSVKVDILEPVHVGLREAGAYDPSSAIGVVRGESYLLREITHLVVGHVGGCGIG